MSATRTRTAPAGQENYPGPDRRKHPRHPHVVVATLQPASGNADVDESVRVFDLSLGGVGLVSDHRYRDGSVWRITLGNGPLLLNAKIRVVFCRARDDGWFDVGCEFC